MLCITFDNFGLGQKSEAGQGKLPAAMRPESIPEFEWQNFMEIGLHLGQPRMLKLLGELDIPTTFYTEGYSAVLHPVEVKRWADEGHEIGLHAWQHEIWATIPTKEREEHLIALGMAAMVEVLGDSAPVGFRPPGFRINAWTEGLLEKYGIKYISRVAARDQAFTDRFAKIGINYADAGEDVPVERLKVQIVDDYLTDAFLVPREYGGLFGESEDADAGYEIAYQSALKHERAKPGEPWIFVAHPMISGNRSWFSFAKFIRRLHAEFGSKSFKTARDVIFSN